MPLTQKEKDVINACITHWNNDIRNHFVAGREARPGMPPRWLDGQEIKCCSEYCPLCTGYVFRDGNCDRCPFVTILKSRCDKSGGLDFAKNPCLDTCNNFIANFYKMLGN